MLTRSKMTHGFMFGAAEDGWKSAHLNQWPALTAWRLGQSEEGGRRAAVWAAFLRMDFGGSNYGGLSLESFLPITMSMNAWETEDSRGDMAVLMTAVRNLGIALTVTRGDPGYARVLLKLQDEVEILGKSELARHPRGLRILLEIALGIFGNRLSQASTTELPVSTPEECVATFGRMMRLDNLELSDTISVAFPTMLKDLITVDASVLAPYQQTMGMGSPVSVGAIAAVVSPYKVIPKGGGGGGESTPGSGHTKTPTSPLRQGGVCLQQLGHVVAMDITRSPGPCVSPTNGLCALRYHPVMSGGGDGPVHGEVPVEELVRTVGRAYKNIPPGGPTLSELEAAIRQAF